MLYGDGGVQTEECSSAPARMCMLIVIFRLMQYCILGPHSRCSVLLQRHVNTIRYTSAAYEHAPLSHLVKKEAGLFCMLQVATHGTLRKSAGDPEIQRTLK